MMARNSIRLLLLLAALGLTACTQATAHRLGRRTFAIEGPGVPGGSDAPNRRLASRLCPNGYRVLKAVEYDNTPDLYRFEPGSDFTNWTIRCLQM